MWEFQAKFGIIQRLQMNRIGIQVIRLMQIFIVIIIPVIRFITTVQNSIGYFRNPVIQSLVHSGHMAPAH